MVPSRRVGDDASECCLGCRRHRGQRRCHRGRHCCDRSLSRLLGTSCRLINWRIHSASRYPRVTPEVFCSSTAHFLFVVGPKERCRPMRTIRRWFDIGFHIWEFVNEFVGEWFNRLLIIENQILRKERIGKWIFAFSTLVVAGTGHCASKAKFQCSKSDANLD